MIRAAILGSLLLVGLDCSETKPAAPPASAPSPAPGPSLAELVQRIAALGEHPVGTEAGLLLEQKAERLLEQNRKAEAKAAFLEAARAYGQSPEATSMPVERSERARKRAGAITP